MRSIFLSPHCDDECIFGSLTILKHKPKVYICFGRDDGYGAIAQRLKESARACSYLGVESAFLNQDVGLQSVLRGVDLEEEPDIVWAPDPFCGHPEHSVLAETAGIVFGGRVRRYDTYGLTLRGPFKVENNLPAAPIDNPDWIRQKHIALSEYHSQLLHPRASQFFRWSLDEYAEQP